MSGQKGRSGRPKSATEKVAHQVRLEEDENELFLELVERRNEEASRRGGTASAASVLRSLVLAAIEAEGIRPKKKR